MASANFRNEYLQLAEWEYGIPFASSRVLPEKQVKLLERILDFVWEVKDAKGRRFIVHIEHQTHSDAEMEFRMQEYHGILSRRFKLPVEQFVVFYGDSDTQQPAPLSAEMKYQGFTLILPRKVNYQLLLNMGSPEGAILAALAIDMQKEPVGFLKKVILTIHGFARSEEEFGNYIYLLDYFSNLCNFKIDIFMLVKSMSLDFLNFSKHNSSFYRGGFREGKEEGEAMSIARLHFLKGLSISQLSSLFDKAEQQIRGIIDSKRSDFD